MRSIITEIWPPGGCVCLLLPYCTHNTNSSVFEEFSVNLWTGCMLLKSLFINTCATKTNRIQQSKVLIKTSLVTLQHIRQSRCCNVFFPWFTLTQWGTPLELALPYNIYIHMSESVNYKVVPILPSINDVTVKVMSILYNSKTGNRSDTIIWEKEP